MIVQAIRARLLTLSALTALVGTRVYALKFPQDPTWPAQRVQQIGEIQEMHLRGSSGLRRARIQVDSVASEQSTNDPYGLADAVSMAADGDFSGGVATGLLGFKGVAGGVAITGIAPADRREMYDPDDRRAVMVSRDYFVMFQG